ncbi:MAG TPA: hypothetical protein PLR83_02730 [Pyrinomonadaceae bacterium]|nr:hypothetical protein [Pyrinomonadaceae bacterium]
MKRIEQKVKDLVELRQYSSNYEFVREPAKALASYRFTDVTSDLMAKWIEKAGRVSDGNGAANALAGFRGVGKSHFLNTFGAIIGIADLRSRAGDPHVDSAAHALGRRKFTVVWAHRGTEETLVAELRSGISDATGISRAVLGSNIAGLIEAAQTSAADASLVVLIDTSLDRSERVSRDDGQELGEIADIAKKKGFFVGVALDDDIAGADGANAAITRSFAIDYLDLEHLYKIVDAHIFPKFPRSNSVIHEIFNYYRAVVPGFRWSEQRFSALFPLHPAIMEIAPFVRLYLHEFALLGFASEAGARIMGRPANSLIAPDEVFDSVEDSLRKIDVLSGAFEIYDRLNNEVVAKQPVVKRLHAKLILKGMMLFSLSEEGSTAAEIGASMLIFDEADPSAAIGDIENVLAAFGTAAPDGIKTEPDSSGKSRYSFRLDAKDGLKSALQAAAERVEPAQIDALLKRLLSERFPDFSFSPEGSDVSGDRADAYLLWRGGVRKGELVWNFSPGVEPPSLSDAADWTVIVASDPSSAASSHPMSVGWIPGEIVAGDRDAFARYWLLLNDAEIRTEHKEHLAAAIQTHASSTAKAFQRIFLDQAVLSIGGFEYNLTEDARGAPSLSQVFSIMLEPLFETKYPEHPIFPHVVGPKEVSSIVSGFFSGSGTSDENLLRLAADCCLPLGIAARGESGPTPGTAEELRRLETVRIVVETVDAAADTSANIATIRAALGGEPYGLVSESVHLILSAMVAARMIEFVTTRGDRINYRSLDLKVIWDDIVAVARPIGSGISVERLGRWLHLVTGASETLSVSRESDAEAVKEALKTWQTEWRTSGIAARYAEVDDCLLTTRTWRASSSIKTFDSVAASIDGLLADELSCEDCLTRIADAFADQEGEFSRRTEDIHLIEEFLSGCDMREKAVSYLSRSELTGEPEIDNLRAYLWEMATSDVNDHDPEASRIIANQWSRYHKLYSRNFVDLHNALPAEADIREKLLQVKKTDVWWEFETLSGVPTFDATRRMYVGGAFDALKRLDCNRDVERELLDSPGCGCGFSLLDAEKIEEKPRDLWQMINTALFEYRRSLRVRLDDLSDVASQADAKADGASLKKLIENERDLRRFTESELEILRGLKPILSPEGELGDLTSFTPEPSEIDAIIDSLT